MSQQHVYFMFSPKRNTMPLESTNAIRSPQRVLLADDVRNAVSWQMSPHVSKSGQSVRLPVQNSNVNIFDGP